MGNKRENLELAIASFTAALEIEQAQQQLSDEAVQRDLINLIETIIVYKLPLKLLPDNSAERVPGSKEGKVKTPNYELNKQTLQNAIQQSSSSKDSKSSNSGS